MGGRMPSGYHKLEIYKTAHSLALRVHAMTLELPPFERFEEGSQIRRSAKSVSTNIVEGYALRKYKKEYLRFLHRAYGSSEETLEHLRFLFETRSLAREDLYKDLSNEYLRLNAMIFGFISSVELVHELPLYVEGKQP